MVLRILFVKVFFLATLAVCSTNFASATMLVGYSFKAMIVSPGEASKDATPDKFAFPKEIYIEIDGECARRLPVLKPIDAGETVSVLITKGERGHSVALIHPTNDVYWNAAIDAINRCYGIDKAFANSGIDGWSNIHAVIQR